MALAQVARVRAALATFSDTQTDVREHSSAGDRHNGPLHQLGGKGAFTKELDGILLDGGVDAVVHCVKDIPGDVPIPQGLVPAAVLTRDDPRDALVSKSGETLAELAPGSRIGTSSVRRAAQIALHWPHLQCVPIRGNADTRLAKLDDWEVDALILAVAGLERLGLADRIAGRITEIINPAHLVPAVGAGALMILVREDDQAALDFFGQLNDPQAFSEIQAERIMLHALQGNCHTPIAGHATTEPDGRISLRARVISPDSKHVIDVHEWGLEPVATGTTAAANLLAKGAGHILSIQR